MACLHAHSLPHADKLESCSAKSEGRKWYACMHTLSHKLTCRKHRSNGGMHRYACAHKLSHVLHQRTGKRNPPHAYRRKKNVYISTVNDKITGSTDQCFCLPVSLTVLS